MAFPTDPLSVLIELFYDGVWNDITQYVYHRDSAPLVIIRGRQNEGKRCDPGSLTCQINNRDGRYTPKNPSSPLFGKIGRYTPIRVKVTYNAVVYTRFVGEIVSWPSRWDVSGKDIWVPLKAGGLLRRLGQGKKPLRSALFRATAGVAAGDYIPHAYWALEDGEHATQMAFSLPGGTPAAVYGDVTFAADAELVGSEPLPFLSPGALIAGQIPAYTDTGQFFFQIALKIDDPPSVDTTYFEIDTPGGDNAKWRLYIQPDSPDIIWFLGYDSSGSLTGAGGSVTLFGGSPETPSEADFYGRWWFFNMYVYVDQFDGFVYGGVAISDNGEFAGFTAGSALETVSAAATTWRLYGGDGLAGGHAALFIDTNFTISDALLNAAAMDGNPGVTEVQRITDLCRQSRITIETVGESEALMGPERVVTLLQALRDAEDVGQGFLYETRDQIGLKYRTNASRYNQIPVPISYAVKGLGHPFDPEPDDLNIANDREVKRRNGSSARRELTTGPLSVEDPPDGMGRLDDSITIDCYTDDQLADIANWRLHVGTWDAERYPRIRIDLSANPALIPDIVPLDSGDLITVSDLPSWLPPGDAELLVEGYGEVIGHYDWDIVFNCSPAGPYNVVGRWALMSHELRADINSATTSIDIVNTDLTQPMLATTALGAGYGITVGGEEMQVTAVAASTITYGAVGTVAHGNNASVVPGLPGSLAQGNLMLLFAAIRNFGGGTPSTPAGWTRLAVFPTTANVQIFAKIAGASESAPTVSFSGGVANADTTAQIVRLAGKWHDVSKILVGSAARSSGTAAQSITYPGLPRPLCDNAIIIYLGWKQDDWTSVASPGTEIAEEDTTTGDDQGIVWAYTIQTTAAAIPSGLFTVTGGGTAINRAAVVALRCDYQTATVTRGIGGTTAASHTAGDDVVLSRPMRWGLL